MQKGVVIKTTGSFYTVRTETKSSVICRIRGKIRLENSKSTSPAVVGDVVDIVSDEKTGDNFISFIHERKNHIVRRSINLSKQTHVIAANIDQAILVVTLAFPETSMQFIDRYLVACEAYKIPALIVINKCDLIDDKLNDYYNYFVNIYEKAGYKCIGVSATTKTGINEFQNLLKDKISLLSGHSGVGKSTLINVVEPGLNLKTQNISDYHLKGKHTTTFSEMHPLSNGGYIIDTPGIKGFGLINIENSELFHYFPDLFKLAGRCQYYNCTHVHEPGCAIKEAIEKDEISETRYINYLQMLSGNDERHR